MATTFARTNYFNRMIIYFEHTNLSKNTIVLVNKEHDSKQNEIGFIHEGYTHTFLVNKKKLNVDKCAYTFKNKRTIEIHVPEYGNEDKLSEYTYFRGGECVSFGKN